jgi:hypothetical protein
MKGVPLEGEVNPNNPVLSAAREHWHKIAAFIMYATKTKELELSPQLMDELTAQDQCIVLQEKGQRLFVRMLPRLEAEKLAREAGGFPV